MIIEFGKKKPKIHPTAFIAPNATVVGDVEIGEGSSVWFGAVIRADTGKIRIGKFCSVQDNCVLHAETEEKGGETRHYDVLIGDYVTVGHGAVVHGCKVEDRCVIGANSSVFNEAVVGEGSTVGTGAVVPHGMKIAPRSIVAGVPAKLLKTVTEAEAGQNKHHAEGYAKLAGEYKKMLG